MSATQKEHEKDASQRAEDIAYTVNHSLYCTLTDFINPPVNAATDGYLRWLIPGCGHDHSKDHGASTSHGSRSGHHDHSTHAHNSSCGHAHHDHHSGNHTHHVGEVKSASLNHTHATSEQPRRLLPKIRDLSPAATDKLNPLTAGSLRNFNLKPQSTRLSLDKRAFLKLPGSTTKPADVKPLTPGALKTVTFESHSTPICAGTWSAHQSAGKGGQSYVCNHGHVHFPEGMPRWEKVKFASKQAFSKERFVQYAKGEFIGDFAAVPITIGMQRFMPGTMHSIRQLTEPLMKPIFDFGIERSSRRWARKYNVDVKSTDYAQHKREVYEHEMGHFPQAVVWTASSLGLNVAYQMHADKCTHTPFWSKLALKSGSVLSGVAVTAGVVVAARALAPHKVREFDQWTSRTAIIPATRAIGKYTGMYNDQDIQRMESRSR